MNEEIIKICIYYMEKIGVNFIENNGQGTICLYNNEEYIWYYNNPYKLFHQKPYKTLDFFKEISKIKTFKKAYQNKCSMDLENVLELDDKELYNIIVNTQNLENYSEVVSNFLDNYKIFKIQSPMATRKTNIVKEIINQSSNKNIIIITNRRTLAQESHNKYKDFHYYENPGYNGGNLIVQFDSLWKYEISEFDIIIMDEITSLLLYISEPYKGKENNYRKNIEKFLNIDEYDNKIVLLDSFIIYHPFRGKELKLYNEFRENIKVIEYKNKYTFFSKIVNISRNESISISSNEKRILKKIYNKLTKKGIRCLLLTADTPNKDKIFEELQNSKCLKNYGYDVLLFSPVVTTGVSFFFNINNHFHFDNSRSIDPVNSIQMIRRIRNAKIIHYYIQGQISYKTTDIEKIKKYNHVLDYFKMYNVRGVTIGLTNAGEKLSKIIRIKNILTNTHKYAFKELMKYQFKEVHLNNFEMDTFRF
jgi:succinate dehydrogenase flavin-adding protein (antitoxin of CptAB toxin-antitoxin module)